MNIQPPKDKATFTVATKSMLAKLMATENIKVEHRNCKTAGFNLKTRTLVCPIWKDMSGDLYDLLMGHEISHALRTPMEGWHDSVVYAGGDKKASPQAQKAFKHFLNVAEDARIEKLVKRQYPGLRRPMINGYKELLAKDFFGLSAISDFNDLYLIDKLNLAAKCGTLVNVRFNSKELPFYNEMMALETWDQVVALTKKLYQYSKEEQKEGEKKKKELADHLKDAIESEAEEGEDGEEGEGEGWDGEFGDEDEDGDDTDTDSDDEDGDEDGEGDSDGEGEDEEEKDGKSSKAKGDKADDKEKKADDKTTEQKADDGKGNRKDNKGDDKKKTNSAGNEGASEGDKSSEEFVPKAKTDESFREKENQLVENEKSESFYINIPSVNLKDLVTPAAIVNAGLNIYYNNKRDRGFKLLNEFKKKNEDYISLLAKEFEMKKAARSYAKAKISDSGDININKLANYRLEDDIFKKMMIVHKGKSHGLVLILDKSGSMGTHLEGAMEQILVMALFCRKVNIPFAAYSFTHAGGAKEHDFPNRKDLSPFSTNKDDLAMGALDLREMFNSKMSASDFTQAIMNHLLLAAGLRNRYNMSIPSHEHMGGTPLNEALVALRDVIRTFKLNHRLDIMNAIVVHDGDSDGNTQFYSDDRYSGTMHRMYANKKQFSVEYSRVTLVDKKENLQISVPKESRGMTIALMNWLQMTAGCGIFGFFITGGTPKTAKNGIMGLYQNKQGIKMTTRGRYNIDQNQMIILDKLSRQVIEEKFLESWTDGYTRFYFIPGGEELRTPTQAVLIESGKNWTPSRLLSAFKKVNRKRHVSRVLVNKFIELMAT